MYHHKPTLLSSMPLANVPPNFRTLCAGTIRSHHTQRRSDWRKWQFGMLSHIPAGTKNCHAVLKTTSCIHDTIPVGLIMFLPLPEIPCFALPILLVDGFRFSFPGVQKPLDQCDSGVANTTVKKAAADDDNFDLFGSEDEEVCEVVGAWVLLLQTRD